MSPEKCRHWINLPVKNIKVENVRVNSLALWKIYPVRSANYIYFFQLQPWFTIWGLVAHLSVLSSIFPSEASLQEFRKMENSLRLPALDKSLEWRTQIPRASGTYFSSTERKFNCTWKKMTLENRLARQQEVCASICFEFRILSTLYRQKMLFYASSYKTKIKQNPTTLLSNHKLPPKRLDL